MLFVSDDGRGAELVRDSFGRGSEKRQVLDSGVLVPYRRMLPDVCREKSLSVKVAVKPCRNKGAMPNRLSARSWSRNMYARSVTSELGKAMNPDANGTMTVLLATSKCGLRM